MLIVLESLQQKLILHKLFEIQNELMGWHEESNRKVYRGSEKGNIVDIASSHVIVEEQKERKIAAEVTTKIKTSTRRRNYQGEKR
jgi:hypothetical protein